MNENKGYVALIYFILRSSFIGLTSMCILSSLNQDAWIGIILGTIVGLFPITLIYKIIDEKSEESLLESIPKLFPKLGKYIKIIFTIFIFTYTCLNFWNLINLITSQYLNKTPYLLISICFLIPIVQLIKKKNQIISQIAFILFIISIFLYILTFIGLISKIEISNILPIMEYNTIDGIYYYISYNVLPIIVLLVFPGKYIKKSLYKGYLLSSISLIISTIVLISVLGIDLTLLFQYPEFHILKLVFDGFITFRLENLLALQWIIDIYILISMGLKFTNESLNIKKIYITPIIMLLICNYFIPNNTIIIYIIKYYYPTIIIVIVQTLLLIIYIKKELFLKNNSSN